MFGVSTTVLESPTPTLPVPLTTIFTPPASCSTWRISTCYQSSTSATFYCTPSNVPYNVPYFSVCSSTFYMGLLCLFDFPGGCATDDSLRCLPQGYDGVRAFSPGIQCPLSWSRVATVTYTSIASEDEIYSSGIDLQELETGETAVICCPPDFQWSADSGNRGQCIQTHSTTTAAFEKCFNSSQSMVLSMTIAPYLPDTIPIITLSGGSTTSVVVNANLARVVASSIQLVWKSEDLISTTYEASQSAPTTSIPVKPQVSEVTLSRGAVAGIAAGVVAIVIVVATILFIWYRRRKGKTPKNRDTLSDRPNLEKPELPGSSPQGQYVKSELHSVPRALHELADTSNPYSELEAAQEGPGDGVTPAANDNTEGFKIQSNR
ncbi:hypothetical protein F4778DRAFT_575558 [Xylariomycetidae sp. FL2044]|nr:hypothetical protein F4778DRAFT_575558 [Xylariomycetidae sp. FL2044]